MKEKVKSIKSSARKTKADVCESCQRSEDPKAILCLVNRLDQLGSANFPCFAYQKKG